MVHSSAKSRHCCAGSGHRPITATSRAVDVLWSPHREYDAYMVVASNDWSGLQRGEIREVVKNPKQLWGLMISNSTELSLNPGGPNRHSFCSFRFGYWHSPSLEKRNVFLRFPGKPKLLGIHSWSDLNYIPSKSSTACRRYYTNNVPTEK